MATGPAAVLPCALAAVRRPRTAGRVALACGLISAATGCAVMFAPRTAGTGDPVSWRLGAEDSIFVVAPFALLAGGRVGEGSREGPAGARSVRRRHGTRAGAWAGVARVLGWVLAASWLCLAVWIAYRLAGSAVR